MKVKTPVSIYRSAKDSDGYKQPYLIEQIIEAIRTPAQYQTATNELRRLKKQTPNPYSKEWKKVIRDFKEFNFKGVTWSGTFSYRNSRSLVQHSGFICLDFDARDKDGGIINGLVGEVELNELRARLLRDIHSYIVFISPSGDGVKVVSKVQGATGENHKEYFNLLKDYYFSHFGIKADTSGSNVDRLCFLPYDPEIYYNETSEPFNINSFDQSIIAVDAAAEFRDTEAQIKYCIGEVKRRGLDLTSNYQDWVKIGLSLSSLGEEGRLLFHEVSCLYFGYDAKECDDKYDNFLKTRGAGSASVSIASFFHYCKEAGVDLTQMPAPTAPENVERKKRLADLYEFIHERNRAGAEITEAEIIFCCEEALMNRDKVEKIIKKIYDENKEEHGIDKKPEIFHVELFLKNNYDFYRNEITTRTDCRLKGETEYDKINLNSIYRKMQQANFKYSFEKIRSLLKSDFVPTVNPFKEYFFSLPEWDGVDHIKKLSQYIEIEGTPDDQNFWSVMFCKALVRSIACSIGGRENRIVMVLVQETQNSGKTSFMRFLNPFGTKYYTEAPLRDGKDTEFRFSENFLYNLEELSSLAIADVNKLKAIISKSVVKERKAYAEDEDEQPRRCNFWGSTNRPEFLTDTENTRWLCFKVKSVSHNYKNTDTGVQEIDINKVWAQAYHLYKSGWKYQLTPEEAARREAANKEYELSSNERDLINTYFKPGDKTNGEFLNSFQIEERMLKIVDNKMKFNRYAIARALTQLGFKSSHNKINGNTSRGYWIIPVNPLLGGSGMNAPAPSQGDNQMTIPGTGNGFTENPDDEDTPF